MSRFRILATALVAVAAMTMCTMPVFANPGNGNGNGNSGNHGNKGNSGNSQKGNSSSKNNQQSEQRKNYGKPDHVDSDISFNVARQYAVKYGLTGYQSLPLASPKTWRVASRCLRVLRRRTFRPRCSINCPITPATNGRWWATIWC